MNLKDPLGIEQLIRNKEIELQEKPITKDQFHAWLQDPVTKQLRMTLGIIVERTKRYALIPSTEATQLTDFQKGEVSGIKTVLSWNPCGGEDE